MSNENTIPAEVAARSAEFQKQLTHNSEGLLDTDQKGVQEILDANLPEGMTPKMAKEFKAEERLNMAAFADAVGEKGLAVFGEDKGIKSVSGTMKWYGDKMAASIEREREVTIPGRGGAGATKETKHNYLVVKHKTQSTNPSGALPKVKTRFQAMAK